MKTGAGNSLVLLHICFVQGQVPVLPPPPPTQLASPSNYARPPNFAAPPSSPLQQALDAYAELTGKTILRPSSLAAPNYALPAKFPSDTNVAMRLLEDELRKQKIEVLPDGELFVRVVPFGWTNSFAAQFLAGVKPPLPAKDTADKGLMSFSSGSVEQVLMIYREIRGRTLLQPMYLSAPSIHLISRQPLARDEAGYAMTVVLALNGIATVDDGDKFVQVFPIGQWKQVEPRAPKPGTNAALFDPKEIPKSPPDPPTEKLKRLNQLYTRLFHHQPPWTPKPVDQLVEIYAELTDQKAAASKDHGQTPVRFDMKTPLTKDELVYAIETTLKLNGLAIAKVEGGRISAIALGEKLWLERLKSPGSEKR